jgi:hypothetical protein
MKLLLGLLMLAGSTGQATAQPSSFTGKTLFDLCSSEPNNAAYLSCVMYIKGFLDGYSARKTTICFPEGLNLGGAAAAFVRVWRSIQASTIRADWQ